MLCYFCIGVDEVAQATSHHQRCVKKKENERSESDGEEVLTWLALRYRNSEGGRRTSEMLDGDRSMLRASEKKIQREGRGIEQD